MPKAKISYADKMKFIRPYVSFDYKRPERVKPATKGKITKYYNFLRDESRIYYAKKVPARNFERIQEDLNPEFQRIPRKIKKTEFKVVFIPKSKPDVKIKYVKEAKSWGLEETVGEKKILETVIEFKDKDLLIVDPKKYVDRLIRKYSDRWRFRWMNTAPKGVDALSWNWKSPGDWDKAGIGGEIERVVAEYPKDADRFLAGLYAFKN